MRFLFFQSPLFHHNLCVTMEQKSIYCSCDGAGWWQHMRQLHPGSEDRPPAVLIIKMTIATAELKEEKKSRN